MLLEVIESRIVFDIVALTFKILPDYLLFDSALLPLQHGEHLGIKLEFYEVFLKLLEVPIRDDLRLSLGVCGWDGDVFG